MSDVYILAAGVVSPWGSGMEALDAGLRAGRCALRPMPLFDQTVRVGECHYIQSIRGEDRAITLLRRALGEIRPRVERLASYIQPENRAVAAATSKGAVMLYLEDPQRAPERMLDLLADAPARFIAGEIGARGPSAALVSACATGLHNILQAAEWIRSGIAKMAVAGSTEATLTPLYLSSFINLGAMNPEGCFPFDQRHAGFVAGEGAAVFLLADEDTARRSGIPPLARIRGWANMAEAYHATAMDTNGAQVEALLRRVLDHAQVPLDAVDLLSCHGTGTVVNDTTEANGLRRLYNGKPMPPVFSTKGAVGHIMGATGSIEFAACLASMTGRYAPATVGFGEPAEEACCLTILTESREARVDMILKWNLGFGGHLVGCVIERA